MRKRCVVLFFLLCFTGCPAKTLLTPEIVNPKTPEHVARLKELSDQGWHNAKYVLASHYLNGDEELIEKDLDKGRDLLLWLAAHAHLESQHDLGVIYSRGTGIEQNYVEAAKWYKMAADRGLAASQFNLALLYFHGLGLEKDYEMARSFFEKAALQGHVKSQYNLAVMYANYLAEPDCKLAHYWLKKAASQGYPPAKIPLCGEKGSGVILKN